MRTAVVAALVLGVGCSDPILVEDDASGAGAGEGEGAAGSAGPTGAGAAAPTTSAVTSGAGGEPPAWTYPDPEWQSGAPEDHGFDPALLAQAVAAADDGEAYCLVVARHGVIVAEAYWQGRDATSREPSWSLAKSYTSAVVGIMLDRGDLSSLDTSVSDLVPAWQDGEHEAITVRHLLSMTSGLAWSAFQDYVVMATFADDHTEFGLDLGAADPPETAWTYHNGGVQVLEAVVRAATGKAMDAYAEEHLFSRIGSGATWGQDPAGNPTAYANVLATCRDHARFGYLYLRGGAWAGEPVVSPSYVDLSLTPSQPFNQAYGLLWWLNGQEPAMDSLMAPFEGTLVPFAPPDLFGARGFGNQFIDVVPSLDLVVVRIAADPAGGAFDLAELAQDTRFEEHDEVLAPILAAIDGP